MDKVIFSITSILILGLITSCRQDCDHHFDMRADDPRIEVHFKADTTLRGYSDYYLKLNFTSQMVSSDSLPLHLYANVGPFMCESNPVLDDFLNPLDSVHVFTNKVYNSGDSFINRIFRDAFGRTIEANIEETEGWWNLEYLEFTEPPDQADTFKFLFRILERNGVVIEVESRPVYITP